MAKKKVAGRTILGVQILEAKPNPMLTEEERQLIRFLRFNRHVPCVACGKKARIMWTALYQFKAGDMQNSSFTLRYYERSFAPLTPVCQDHPLAPHFGGDPVGPPPPALPRPVPQGKVMDQPEKPTTTTTT
jgi:hypothetical protein